MKTTYLKIREKLKSNPNFERLLMFDRVFRGDENYFIPAKDWYDEFFLWFKIQLKNYHVWDYQASWDCDKYANAFQVFGNICHAQGNPHVTESLAIAEIHYSPTKGDARHAINAVIVNEGELLFIEPQSPAFVTLSPSEQRSITFMKW